MHKPILLIAGLAATPAAAGTIGVTIPQLKVAEYHRPYVAGWIEPAGGGAAQTLFVWYQVKKGGEPGTKWLADLRTWWRKGGRSLNLPADGVSGATRPPGTHQVAIPTTIKPGAYMLYVEAARETGGREIVSTPFTVPTKPATTSGKVELGAITLSAR